MDMMYTSVGWVEVKLPPFLDLDEICRKQDQEEIEALKIKSSEQIANNK